MEVINKGKLNGKDENAGEKNKKTKEEKKGKDEKIVDEKVKLIGIQEKLTDK